MKRSSIFACLLASGLGLTALAQTTPAPAAAAAPAGPTKIAIIAFQGAVQNTNEGLRNFGQLRTKFEPRVTAVKTQSDEVEQLKIALKSQGDKLSDQERATRTKTIDDKEKALQRIGEDLQNDEQTEASEMYGQLAQKVYTVAQTYAEQNKYTVVLDISTQQSPVLWANASTDITQAVVQAYNAQSGIAAPPAGSGAAAPASRPAGTAPRSPATTPRPAPRTTPTTPK